MSERFTLEPRLTCSDVGQREQAVIRCWSQSGAENRQIAIWVGAEHQRAAEEGHGDQNLLDIRTCLTRPWSQPEGSCLSVKLKNQQNRFCCIKVNGSSCQLEVWRALWAEEAVGRSEWLPVLCSDGFPVLCFPLRMLTSVNSRHFALSGTSRQLCQIQLTFGSFLKQLCSRVFFPFLWSVSIAYLEQAPFESGSASYSCVWAGGSNPLCFHFPWKVGTVTSSSWDADGG